MIHRLEEVTLSAGTKGLLIDVPSSQAVNLRLAFRAGFQFGDFGRFETPHLLEHNLLNATRTHPAINELKTLITANGAYTNAFTNTHLIGYVAECADFDIGHVLSGLGELITEPLLSAEHIQTERENVREELSSGLSDYGRQAAIAASVYAYPKLMLDYRTRLDQLDGIGADDVATHYRATHTRQNGRFVVCGAVTDNRDLIIARLEELFGKLPDGRQRPFWDGRGRGRQQPLEQVVSAESLHFYLSWFSDGGGLRERVAAHLLRSLLTGGFGSRIFGRARKEGLTYHLGSTHSWTTQASSFSISGFCSPAKWPRLLEVIAEELGAAAGGGLDEEELGQAKRRVTGSILLGSQTASDVAGWYSSDYFYDESIESYDDYVAALQTVTVAEVAAVAAASIRSTDHLASLVGPVTAAETSAVERQLRPVWI